MTELYHLLQVKAHTLVEDDLDYFFSSEIQSSMSNPALAQYVYPDTR